MTSLIFYWLLWGMWIVVTFLMAKGRLRSQLMFGLLILIIVTSIPIDLPIFKVNAGWMALLLWGYSFYIKRPLFTTLTLMFSNLSITLCYVLIRIYWLMDPAIFLILEKWMFTVGLTVLTMAIVKPFWLRLSTAAIGVCQGDLLQSILFYPYDKILGESDCMNALTVSFIFILGWSGIQYLTQKAQESLNKQVNQRF